MQSAGVQPPPADIAVTYKVKVTPRLVWAILAPYVWEKASEQIRAVLPISAFLTAFQFFVMGQSITYSLEIGLGLGAVALGLMFFMEGIRLGLMPLGEAIGASLPAKAGLALALSLCFVVGMVATLAEPAVPTLGAGAASVKAEQAPLLYDMLNRNLTLVLLAVAVGVGFGALLGIYRFVRNRTLKSILLPSIALSAVLTLITAMHPETAAVLTLAWDAGGVTTGPVTTPLVLALGLGFSAVLGKSDTSMSGFGIITLATLWPVSFVLVLVLALFYSGSSFTAAEAVAAAAQAGNSAGLVRPDFGELFPAAGLTAVQAVFSLGLLLFVIQRVVLGEEVNNLDQILLGIVFTIVGLLFFHVGLRAGLIPMGQQVGSTAPMAFAPPLQLFGETWGRAVVLAFAGLMGYAATLAEPALAAVARTVEDVTAGAFKKKFLMHIMAAGVGAGICLGVARILFGWPLLYLILPSYLLLAALTFISDEEFINIGWDAAGATPGDITVPLVLAMGLGIATQVGAVDGYGILALVPVFPISSFLVLGLVVRRSRRTPASSS